MKPPKPRKSSSQFSIEMDLKGLVVFLSLATLTGATLFYLGLTFGKASRSANQKIDVQGITTPQAELTPPKDLKIYDLGGRDSNIDQLKNQFEALKSDSEPAIHQEKLVVEEDTAKVKALKTHVQQHPLQTKSEPPSQASAGKPSTPVVSWPDIVQDTQKKEAEVLYTVQLLTTRQRSKADKLVNVLKQKGFSAYVDPINPEGTPLYRVRVSKENATQIQKIKARLTNVVQGLGPMSVVQLR